MLADLLIAPKTQVQWSIWGFAHRDQHQIVRQAIQQKAGVNLVEYPLDPIPFQNLTQWMLWHQQAHDDVNGVLKTQSNNLEQSNLTDPNELQAWIYLHRIEHETWSKVLGVS